LVPPRHGYRRSYAATANPSDDLPSVGDDKKYSSPGAYMNDLLDVALGWPTAEKRTDLMRGAVSSWEPTERDELASLLVQAIVVRAAALNEDAIAADERGEDISAALAAVQVYVEITTQIKPLVEEINKAEVDANNRAELEARGIYIRSPSTIT
jgi:hypothetical protein